MRTKPCITRQEIARSYQSLPSFVEHLPWRDYNEKYKCLLLEDNTSFGVCFKITPIPCEARPIVMLEDISAAISEAIKNSIPCEKGNPWILQIYATKQSDLSHAYQEIEDSFPEKRKSTRVTQDFLMNMKEHLEYVSRPEGIFHDSQVTNLTFRGGFLHVFAVLYRRKSSNQKTSIERYSRLEKTLRIARKFSNQLIACGLRIKRMQANEFYDWMVKWFNPKKSIQNNITYPDSQQKPIGFDLSEQLFYSTPESFEEGWLFDGMPHKVITIQSMTTNPEIGHLSAERKRNTDDKVFNLIDHLPEASVFVITIIMQAPSEVDLHLKTIHGSAVGNHAQAVKVKEEIALAEKSIANGNFLLPVVMNLYMYGESLDDLHAKEAQAEVLLNSNGFKVITDDELFPCDAYLRYLPMCYDFQFDKQNSYRSRYFLLSDIAKLLPFYGRSRGTNHPGLVCFNRGGEPCFYDFMQDKTKNSHFLLLGESGTGKSNLLCFIIMYLLARHFPKLFVMDVGGSFDLLGEYCKSLGLTVNKIKIDTKQPTSLNPFADGLRIIDQIESIQAQQRNHYLHETCEKLINSSSDDDDDDEDRDILGDMVLSALIMITGGEKKEEETIRRSDRMLIMDAIIDAAYFVRNQKRGQMVAGDIVEAFERITLQLDPSRDVEKIRRAREMADSMRYFIKDPMSSQFFNSHGNPWIDADITIVDFGLFAREGYEAHRSIAFAGCLNHIQTIAEANQNSDRAIYTIIDENHIFTSIPLLANIQTRVAKTGRKLGLWLGVATQNMKDFPEGARRMLAQLEHWICLHIPPTEIDEIEDFIVLTPEQRSMLLSTRKEKGKYTEGAIFSPLLNALIRNVPPTLYLSLAATEQDEKNHRLRLMHKHHCTEIEAVKMIARDMMKLKKENYHDD
ncbi:MAG: conjugative transfer ATPase [Gammaproteobacteria bacterium]